MKKILAVSLLLILTTPFLTGCFIVSELAQEALWKNQYWSTVGFPLKFEVNFAVKKGDYVFSENGESSLSPGNGDYVFSPGEDVILDVYFSTFSGKKVNRRAYYLYQYYENADAKIVLALYLSFNSNDAYLYDFDGEYADFRNPPDTGYFLREISEEEACSDEYAYNEDTNSFPFQHHERITVPRELFDKEKKVGRFWITIMGFVDLNDQERGYISTSGGAFELYYKWLADGSLRISGQQIM